MVPQRIGVKLFFEPAKKPLDLSLFIPVFHKWIRTQPVDGMLIDVADYKHVPDGPGIMLIGHEGDFSIDLAEGRAGLRYVRKRDWQDSDGNDSQILQARLTEVLRMVQLGADALAKERKLRRTLKIDVGALQFTFNDQLRAPNTSETLDALRDDLLAVLASTYEGGFFDLERVSTSPYEALTVNVTVREAAAQAA